MYVYVFMHVCMHHCMYMYQMSEHLMSCIKRLIPQELFYAQVARLAGRLARQLIQHSSSGPGFPSRCPGVLQCNTTCKLGIPTNPDEASSTQ